MDTIVLDELGNLPSSINVGQLFFHPSSEIYAKTSALIAAGLTSGKCPQVFDDPGMATALPDRMTHDCQFAETGGDSRKMKNAALWRSLVPPIKYGMAGSGIKAPSGRVMRGLEPAFPPMLFFKIWPTARRWPLLTAGSGMCLKEFAHRGGSVFNVD